MCIYAYAWLRYSEFSMEAGRVCVRLQEKCWGAVREAIERKVDEKWGVGGFTDEACIWSFRAGELM